MEYRVNFSRLARNESEVIKDTMVDSFLVGVLKSYPRARKAFEDYKESLSDGHIEDRMVIYHEDKNVTGRDLIKIVRRTYPEAELLNWEMVK